MTTFLSEDFKQVFGTFNAVNMPPEPGQIMRSSILPSNPVTNWPPIDWSGYRVSQNAYEPTVRLSPLQEQQIQAAKQKLLEDLKKSDSAIKYDAGKADWSLMPWEAVEEINKVLEFGAQKYNEKDKKGPNSWNWAKGTGLGRLRVLNAVFRHLFAYARGEKLDPESGLSHLNHAACGLLFMIYYNKYPDKYPENDGR